MSVQEQVRVAPEALVVDAPLAYPPDPIVIDPKPKPVEEVTAADVLEHAADLLGEFGWCQGRAGSKKEGEMCLVGAVYEAQQDFTSGACNPFRWLRAAGIEVNDVADWNDAPERTAAEVVAKLREAARHARGQELGGHGLGAVPRSAGDQ